MKPKSTFRSVILFAGSTLLAVSFTHAASLYWDTDSDTSGAGGPTPSGNWSTGGFTWSTSPDGTATAAASTTAATDDLFFSAGTNATGAYTITLIGSQDARSLTFRNGTATISGAGGIINLGGTGSINVPNSITASALSATIGANTGTILAGSTGLTKTGVGTLTLNGTAANTVTGGLNVNGGSLVLDFTNLTTFDDLINNGNALSLGGGNLSIVGNPASTNSQSFGNVTVNSGGGSLLANPNGGGGVTVTLGSLTATASGGGFIVGKALSAGTGTLSITTTSDKDATGIYGGRVVFADGTANTGYDWATTATTSPGPYELSAYTGYAALDLTAGTDTANSRITASQTTTGSRTTNSLKFENPASAQTLTNTGFTLTLANGGLLFTGAAVTQGPRIAGGSITAGDGTAPADLVVHQYNASSTIAIGTIGSGISNNTTISSDIVNNGSNAVTLVKNGPGGLVVSGAANTFTGGIVVNGGNLAFNTLGAINNNPITFNSNSIVHTFAGSSTSGNITLNNGSQVTFLNNNSSFTVTGNVLSTSGGGISLANGGQGAITLNLNGTGNTFTGPIRFTANNGTQPATLNIGSLVDTDTSGTGNITFGAGSATPTGNTFNIASTATAPISLTNRRFDMAGDLVLHTIGNNSTQAFTINPDLVVTGTRAKNLTLGGSGTGTSTFAGVISNHPTPTAPGTVPIAVRTTAAIGAGTAITLGSVEGIVPGATISGTSIAAGTTIATVNPLTRQVTLSAATSGAIAITTIFTIPDVVNSVSLTKAGTGTWVLSNENSTYSGPTLISVGMLEVKKLADTGTSSSIGTGGSGSSTIGLGQGATLRYTGSSNSSTNRAIASTTTGNNTGFILDASGAGTVQFTNTAILAAGNNNQGRYYTLTGDNAGDNTLAAQINNNGTSTDNTNITKSGTGKWVLTNESSSFTGGVFLNNGTLSTPSLKNSGVASPLGAGIRLPLLGNGNNNGTLEYTGSGDSSNRDTRIGTPNTIPGTGGGSILNNGSGALTFTAPTFNLAQTGITDTRTLTLGGSYTGGANEIQGVIQDNTASTGLVNLEKSGSGIWKLSGANTYTGNTTVTSGTLELADNAQLKFVLGATSGTNNSISGAGTATLNGDFVIDTTAADALPGGTWTLENVSTLTGAYGSTFTVVGFTDAGGDKWTKVNGSTLYTFNETTGVLTLASASSGYSSWASVNGAGANLNDDHDGDGVDNGTEYFLGGPSGNTTGFTALPTVVNTAGTLSVTWVKGSGYTGVYGTDFTVETSATLADPWTTESVGVNVTDSATDVKYTFPGGPPYSGKNFARLKVTGP